MNNFGDFTKEDIYFFKKWGSFGRFSTIKSFPIEFFLTTLKSSELDSLTFARDIKSSTIDFEQLLQRDIDEERVKTEIEPYIMSPKLTAAEAMSKTVFFPPLLVAAVPVNRKKMEEYYSSQIIDQKNEKKVVREWTGLFKLNLGKEGGYIFNPSLIDDLQLSVSKEPAHIEINLSNGIEKGIKLIVIDGQHRLKALNDIYKKVPDSLRELAIPICILFSPNSTEAVSLKLNNETFNVPTVSEIFRQLFVDVNKNAVQVGGHFNILLSEGNMGSLICRSLCTKTLEVRSITGLAQIEWNQKNKKLSTEITKRYYLTSIGVLEKAFSETFGRSKTIFNYLMHFDEIKNEVHPIGIDDHIEYPLVSWDRFSFSQKKHIKIQLDKHILPVLDRLLFETNLFKPSTKCFNDAVEAVRTKINAEQNGDMYYQPVLDFLLEYTPISDAVAMREAKHNYRIFEEEIGDCKYEKCFSLLGYAIFQRSLILVWLELAKIGKICKVSPKTINYIFISLVNEITTLLPKLINPNKSYCQSFIYIANKVNPTNDTRLGLAYLMMSYFSNEKNLIKVLSAVTDDFNEDERALDKLKSKLQNFSFFSLNEYISLYRKNRIKVFKASYITDRSIDLSDREELQEAENTRKQDEKDYKDGRITKDSINNDFEILVEKHIVFDVNNAKKDITNIYSLELDVFGLTELLERSDYLESEINNYSDFEG